MHVAKVHALAAGAWVGALVPVPLAWPIRLALIGLALASMPLQAPLLLVVACVISASAGSAAAWAALTPTDGGSWSGTVTLRADPSPTAGGVRVVAEIDGELHDLRAWGAPAGHLRSRLMGERVELTATLRSDRDAPLWVRAREIVGRGTVTAFRGHDVGALHTRIANSVRRTIASGASVLSRSEQSLFSGLVYGDDRAQSTLVTDNFKAAGMTHLLAVSGQNVAFVLSIVGPLLRRLGPRSRFAAVLMVLLLFATVTRFEASVVRASVMTAVASVGALIGSELSSRRVLSLAIAALILLDPLIVHSVAFQLSVAASAGILFWSGRVARALPGPRVVAEAIAVTCTAQIAVAPLIVVLFGGLPVASLPANLLGGPAAGPVMMWGLTGGLAAGRVPSWLANLIHQPTRVALAWIDGVAAIAPHVALGELVMVHIVTLGVLGWLGLRARSSSLRALIAALIVVCLLLPGANLLLRPPRHVALDDASWMARDHAVTVVYVASASRPAVLLEELRRAATSRIDLLVVEKVGSSTRETVRALDDRYVVEQIWAPAISMGFGEEVPSGGAVVEVDGRSLRVEQIDDRLRIEPGD